MEEQVRNLSQLVETTNKQLKLNSTNMRETNASKALLESELKSKLEIINKLHHKLEKLGSEAVNLRNRTETTNQLDGHYTRLTR